MIASAISSSATSAIAAARAIHMPVVDCSCSGTRCAAAALAGELGVPVPVAELLVRRDGSVLAVRFVY